jgi:hypothetical protein
MRVRGSSDPVAAGQRAGAALALGGPERGGTRARGWADRVAVQCGVLQRPGWVVRARPIAGRLVLDRRQTGKEMGRPVVPAQLSG